MRANPCKGIQVQLRGLCFGFVFLMRIKQVQTFIIISFTGK